tara:strand:+ start:8486 stop:9097 length:612 start_codon:yes stop_codon:yes gene_type:complete
MKELAWIFGKSSDFSQTIVKELENNDISVYQFGRDNINYDEFDAFRMMKVLPDILILNANIEERIALQINKDNFYDVSPQDMKDMLNEYAPVFLFFTKLIKWLEYHGKGVKLCAISSSITAWPHKSNEYIMYAVLRSMLQQVVFSASSNVTTAFCVSPSGIDTNNKEDYARRIIDLTLNSTDLKLIDLSIEGDIIDLERYKNE